MAKVEKKEKKEKASIAKGLITSFEMVLDKKTKNAFKLVPSADEAEKLGEQMAAYFRLYVPFDRVKGEMPNKITLEVKG